MPFTSETKRQDSTLLEEPTAGTPIQYPTKGRQLLILFCLVLGTFLVAMDTTISVAIPTISTDFEALDDVEWYGSTYLMTLTAFQPTMNKIYKTFSPKMAYIASVTLFEGMLLISWSKSSSSIFSSISQSAQCCFICDIPHFRSLVLK